MQFSTIGGVKVSTVESLKEEKAPKHYDDVEVIEIQGESDSDDSANSKSTIRVRLVHDSSAKEDEGFAIDIRKFVESAKYSGPTKKGVFLSMKAANEVMQALQELLS